MKFQNAKLKFLEIDLKGCVYLNHFSRSERITTCFKIVSRLGDGIFWDLMVLSVWIVQGLIYSLQIIYLVLGSTVGTLIYKVLKTKTVRPRPYQVHQVIRLGDHPLDHFSFPSGHPLHAVMATVVLGYVVPALLFLMLLFTILVALSRMVLGLHYPSDVVVGALLGGVLAMAIVCMAPFLNIVL